MTYVSRWDLAQQLRYSEPDPLLAWIPRSSEFAAPRPALTLSTPRQSDPAFVDQLREEVRGLSTHYADSLLKQLYAPGPDFYWVATPEEALDNELAHARTVVWCLMVAVGAGGWRDRDEDDEMEDW